PVDLRRAARRGRSSGRALTKRRPAVPAVRRLIALLLSTAAVGVTVSRIALRSALRRRSAALPVVVRLRLLRRTTLHLLLLPRMHFLLLPRMHLLLLRRMHLLLLSCMHLLLLPRMHLLLFAGMHLLLVACMHLLLVTGMHLLLLFLVLRLIR